MKGAYCLLLLQRFGRTYFFHYSIQTYMKLFLMLAAIYALILNQSLKQKERQSISVQGNMRTTPKSPKVQPGNLYLNASFHPVITNKPVSKRKTATEKRTVPVRSYQPNPFPQQNDPKDTNENMLQGVFYPVDYSSSALAPKDGSR